jgi:hypothetical protein
MLFGDAGVLKLDAIRCVAKGWVELRRISHVLIK